MKHYDIIIIGLGPAGSILASGLKSSYSILAIDKKDPDSPDSGFRKPCGGLLAPDAQKALAEVSLSIPKEIVVDPQVFSVYTVDFDNDITRYYQRMYVNIDRHLFDLWLMNKIPNRVQKATSSIVTSISKDEEGKYRVAVRDKEGLTSTYSGDILIGADGASSIVRHFLYPKAKYRYYTAIQQWFPNINKKPIYSCIFDAKITDCYSWSVSKDGYLLFGGAYPSKNSKALFEEQKAKVSGKLKLDFQNPVKTEACLVLRPSANRQFFLGHDRAFLVGEAAGFISPSSLEGISSAINSAVILKNVLNEEKDGDLHKQYRKKTRSLRRKLILKNLKCFFIYRPHIRKIVMKSGLQSIKVSDIFHN